MHFRPLHDRVVVQRIDAEERLRAASSFLIPRKRSRRRARSSPLARARATSRGNWSRST